MAPRITPIAWAGVACAVSAAATLVGMAVVGPAAARAAVMGAPKALPYAEAVGRTHAAAKAVLAGAGAESCLRGKLTNALLLMSSSCEASGERNPLCQLADRAAVVTPMSLAFMRDTSTRLLALIDTPAGASGSARP
ncbi:hypothetical protein [Synechococcus sp. CCY 9618]|uniref:hypothetical protein n=1 Tax=Synechococcus sp. CCY 9618 TaxID=2815602 RepID=UPI0020B3945F|nr:hypothetical protein [Synechococcus sp. CCY 9618]